MALFKMGIPVLMYHALDDGKGSYTFPDPGERSYVLKTDSFRRHLHFLKKHGYKSYLFHDLSPEKMKKSVIITFDDGHESNYTLALPMLREFGFKAIFFITAGWIGKDDYLKPQQIKELCQEGMAIGSHGLTHTYLDDLDDMGLKHEFKRSKEILEDITGRKIEAFSAPGGRFNKRAQELAKSAGYKILCTSSFGLWHDLNQRENIPRISLKRDISLKKFYKIMDRDPLFYTTQFLKIKGLYALKKVLGNRVYDFLWNSVQALRNK